MSGLVGPAPNLPRVAAVGCGFWGKNIARNLAHLGALHSICEPDTVRAARVSAEFGVPLRTLDQLLEDSRCDAIALASPAALHGRQVRRALDAGKHVFVEKPLALNLAEGEKLAVLARQRSRVLMVGHLLHYHPHILKLIELVKSGKLGEVKCIYANRLSPGRLRSEEDVMWSFAPHDISVILAIMGEMPTRVRAEGSSILSEKVVDIASIFMDFAGGVSARVHVSWINPYKEQKITVVGSKATAIFDDRVAWQDKLLVFDHQIVYRDGRPWSVKAQAERYDLKECEPLREECGHFLDSVRYGTPPRTDSAEAIRVLAVLDAASRAVGKRRPPRQGFDRHRPVERNLPLSGQSSATNSVAANDAGTLIDPRFAN
ncbi:MAG TPA: Gfo/Idh/MocA family oxidoreductase [Rhizomicrobium sp.]